MTHRTLPAPQYPAHVIRHISIKSGDTDPRTVRAYLAGLPVRPSIASRVAIALRAMGLPDPREASAS